MGPGTRDTGHEGHRAQVTVGTRDTGHEPRFGGVGVPALAGVILPLSWLFHPPPPPGPWDTGVLPWRGGRTPGSRAGGGHRGQERGPRSVGGSPGWGDTGGAWGGLGPSGGVGEGGAEAWAIPWGGRGVPGRSGVPGGGSPIPAPPPRHRLQPFRFRFSHPAGPGSICLAPDDARRAASRDWWVGGGLANRGAGRGGEGSELVLGSLSMATHENPFPLPASGGLSVPPSRVSAPPHGSIWADALNNHGRSAFTSALCACARIGGGCVWGGGLFFARMRKERCQGEGRTGGSAAAARGGALRMRGRKCPPAPG